MFIDSDFELTVLKVVSANRLRNSPVGVSVQHPNRKRWSVALKQQGKTYYTVGGQDILSDAHHPVLLPGGCSYSWKCVEPGDCIMIEFEAAQRRTEILSFDFSDENFFSNEFDKVRLALRKPTPDGQLEAMSRLYAILQHLVKSATKDYVPKGKRQLLQPALRYISEHYDIATITNQQLAQLCGISTVYFRKCFTGVYGVSPIRYLHDLRIQRAKDILSGDYGSIAQVAEAVGYGSVYHFSKMFRQYTGLSPSQYAKE